MLSDSPRIFFTVPPSKLRSRLPQQPAIDRNDARNGRFAPTELKWQVCRHDSILASRCFRASKHTVATRDTIKRDAGTRECKPTIDGELKGNRSFFSFGYPSFHIFLQLLQACIGKRYLNLADHTNKA